MKRYIRFFCLMLALILSAGCTAPTAPETEGETTVNHTQKLPEGFILGMDASCVPALEASGVKYYDFEGKEQDVFKTLAENGINYIRVRVWNHPFDENGNGYGGGNCDIQNALAIGKRATQYGMKLLVDFHYSDFWADPGKQLAPLAWQGMDIDKKADALSLFTTESLQLLKDSGVNVGMVQIGNETNGKMCGESDWGNICKLMNAGAGSVRKIFPEAQVAVHFTNPEKAGTYKYYANQLYEHRVDYDVFASSYYPYWHGTVDNLSKVLTEISQGYGKKVMVAETSYAYTMEDSDCWGNTISSGAPAIAEHPYTPEGQAGFIKKMVNTVASIPGGIGVFYWEGTWISVGNTSLQQNQALWETYGSGWASSYAAAYDSEDAGKWYGGCAVENQAIFDENGKPLPSLEAFRLLQAGNLP